MPRFGVAFRVQNKCLFVHNKFKLEPLSVK